MGQQQNGTHSLQRSIGFARLGVLATLGWAAIAIDAAGSSYEAGELRSELRQAAEAMALTFEPCFAHASPDTAGTLKTALEATVLAIDRMSDDEAVEAHARLAEIEYDGPLERVAATCADVREPDPAAKPKNHDLCPQQGEGIASECECAIEQPNLDLLCETAPFGFEILVCGAARFYESLCGERHCDNLIDEQCETNAFRNWVEHLLEQIGEGVDASAGNAQETREAVDAMQSDLAAHHEAQTAEHAEILEEVLCRPVAALLRGHGCDGVDNDCDRSIDGCAEDVVGPTVWVDAAISVPWHQGLAEATELLARAVHAEDDCQAVTIELPSLIGRCGSVVGVVAAIDACGNRSEQEVVLKVDGSPPTLEIAPSLAGQCFPDLPSAEAAVLAAVAVNDDCTPTAELVISLSSTVTDCQLRVDVTATDAAGNATRDSVVVISDNEPPSIHFDEALAVPWYRDLAEAAAAAARAVVVTDNCLVESVGAPVLTGFCGAVQVEVQAVDGCGNTAIGRALARVDGTPPMIVIPASLRDACFRTVEEAELAVMGATMITDDCTPADELDIRLDSTVTDCSLRIRIEAIDLARNRSTAAITVRVDDAVPFVEVQRLLLGFRGQVLGFQTPVCFPDIASAEAEVAMHSRYSDNCTARERIATSITSSGDPCSLRVVARGTDECGLENTDEVTVRVDSDPPDVACAVLRDRLWPANHEMIDVGFSFSANDNCSGPLELEFWVTTDERTASSGGAGQASPAPDAELLRGADGQLQAVRVRAERESPGDGRVYVITVQATDACGNVASASSSVSVPRGPGGGAVDSGQYYDATAVN